MVLASLAGIAYAGVHGETVLPGSARRFVHDSARARRLQQTKGKEPA